MQVPSWHKQKLRDLDPVHVQQGFYCFCCWQPHRTHQARTHRCLGLFTKSSHLYTSCAPVVPAPAPAWLPKKNSREPGSGRTFGRQRLLMMVRLMNKILRYNNTLNSGHVGILGMWYSEQQYTKMDDKRCLRNSTLHPKPCLQPKARGLGFRV